MTGNDIITKDSDLWQTPRPLFESLDKEFNFDYDVCQNGVNGLAPFLGDYFTADYKNCVCFMNPPYSSPNKFIDRAITLIEYNVQTVCLLKCDTSTNLFHQLYNNYEIRFLKGRLNFTHPNMTTSRRANFPSMIVVIK